MDKHLIELGTATGVSAGLSLVAVVAIVTVGALAALVIVLRNTKPEERAELVVALAALVAAFNWRRPGPNSDVAKQEKAPEIKNASIPSPRQTK